MNDEGDVYYTPLNCIAEIEGDIDGVVLEHQCGAAEFTLFDIIKEEQDLS